jgi:hypothetical protein
VQLLTDAASVGAVVYPVQSDVELDKSTVTLGDCAMLTTIAFEIVVQLPHVIWSVYV